MCSTCASPRLPLPGHRPAAAEHLLRGRRGRRGEAFLEARPSNTSAIRLYQSLGFAQVGMRRGYYQAVDGREDAAVVKLPLRAPRYRPA